VLATKEGKVVTATYSSSAGNYVAIYHGNGLYSYYMHCSLLNVSVGDKVKQGQVIARSGSTGISTGPHLHFAIYKNGNYVNPMYYVKQP
jgi:murein DD-endopeptidase MepM/ murein hydrolase activator NlpD